MTEVKQKINLYLPRFQPEILSKETKQLFQSVLVTVGILSVVIISLFIMNSAVELDVTEKKKKVEVLSNELEKAISRIPNVIPDANLTSRITKEKYEIKKKQQVITYLYQDTISEGGNFTSLVDQLAQISVKNIWLNRFEILNKGRDIQLFGQVKDPSLVSAYIEMLGTQDSYKGRNFQQIKVNELKVKWNSFYISTLSLEELHLLEGSEVEQ